MTSEQDGVAINHGSSPQRRKQRSPVTVNSQPVKKDQQEIDREVNDLVERELFGDD